MTTYQLYIAVLGALTDEVAKTYLLELYKMAKKKEEFERKENSIEEYNYLSEEKFDEVKAKLRQMVDDGWEVPKMVACIYDLFQEYVISEIQEQILYQIVDPFEDYNECSEYWHEMDYENPLLQIVR